MGSLTAENQCGFVPTRQITDNILIYQKMLHSMRTRTIGQGTMILKIDLDKAYGRLSWSFIRDTLTGTGDTFEVD